MFIKLMGALLAVIAVGAFFVCIWMEYGPRRDDETDDAREGNELKKDEIR